MGGLPDPQNLCSQGTSDSCSGHVPHRCPLLLPEALTPAPALGPACTWSTPVLHATGPCDAAPPQEAP